MFPCNSSAHGRLPLFSNHIFWNHPLRFHVNQLLVEDRLFWNHILWNLPLCFHVNQMLTGTTPLFRPLWLVAVVVAVLKEDFHCITFFHELRLQSVRKLAHCSREIWQNVALPVFGWFCCCCFLFVFFVVWSVFSFIWWTVALLAL